jgi:hypothetical protein
MKVFFWVFTPCNVLGLFQWFGGMYYLHLQGNWILFGCTLKWLAGRNFMKVWGHNKPSILQGLQPWKITIIWITIVVCSLLLLVPKAQYSFMTFSHMNVNVPLITVNLVQNFWHTYWLWQICSRLICVFIHMPLSRYKLCNTNYTNKKGEWNFIVWSDWWPFSVLLTWFTHPCKDCALFPVTN